MTDLQARLLAHTARFLATDPIVSDLLEAADRLAELERKLSECYEHDEGVCESYKWAADRLLMVERKELILHRHAG